MSHDELRQLVSTASWFTNLGKATAAPRVIPVTDMGRWEAFCSACTKVDFFLPCDSSILEEFPFADLEWLPTSNEQVDPIHGGALEALARKMNREHEFRAIQMDLFNLALISQRIATHQSVLKVGPTDLNEAAKMGGRFACRMAAVEVCVEQVGFWCEMVRYYHDGHWPFARLPGGEVVIL